MKFCRALLGMFLFSGFVFLGTAQAEEHPASQPVKDLFIAMSKHDGEAMRATSTKDFQLLEHGEDWSMQKLVDAVKPNRNSGERKNFFQQIRARQNGDVAWISYWNKAELRRGDQQRTIVWLESAVVVKQDGRWKIQLMHSTRLDQNKHPSNVKWVPVEETP